jgi:hypothetical protein
MTVRTIDQVVAVYGGEKAFCRAFRLRKADIETWRQHGVPRGHTLGLYLGLKARGAEPSPHLFGIKSWREFPGT